MEEDVRRYFNKPGNIDRLFTTELNNHHTNSRTPVSIYWLTKYTEGTYSTEFQKVLFSYVELALSTPEMSTENVKVINLRSRILVYHFDEVFHSLSDMSHFVSLENIFVPMVTFLGEKTKELFEESNKYILILDRLVKCGKVYEVFIPNNVWTTQITPYFHHINPLIDSFFEPFLYKPSDMFCHYTMNLSDIREVNNKFNEITKRNNDILYEVITFLIKKDKRIKENFINYLREKYLKNKDKLKMMYNKNMIVSDGFCFNLNYVLLLLGEGIIKKGIKEFDLSWFKGEEYKLSNEGLEPIHKVNNERLEQTTSESKFNLQTAVFFSKIIFTGFSFNKIIENLKILELDPQPSEGTTSLIYVYKLILYSSPIFLEKTFFNFLNDYLLENKNSKEIPDLIWDIYFNFVEFLTNISDETTIPKELINLFIFKRNELIKLIYYSFKKYDLIILIKLYVMLENKSVKNELRYFLIKILINSLNSGSVINDCTDKLELTRFYSYIINDLENVLSTIISSIIDFKRLLKEKNEESIRIKKSIEGNLTFLNEIFSLIDLIDLKNYISDNLIGQFISVINHNLKALIGPNCNELGGLKIDFKDILRRVLKMYIRLNDNEKFIRGLVSDKINFNISLLKRAFVVSENKYILNNEELKELNNLINSISKTITEVVNVEEIVPDEFVDPLTYVMMENPVVIDSSKVTVDKSTYEMLLIGQMDDPFSRGKLGGYIEDVELKKRIDDFKRESRSL